MCAAALVHARVKRLVFGARDHRWGGVGSLFDLSHDPRMNHEIEVVSGVMEEEAAELLQHFMRGCDGFTGRMIPTAERCPRGRRGLTRNQLYPRGTGGSNPSLSAKTAKIC